MFLAQCQWELLNISVSLCRNVCLVHAASFVLKVELERLLCAMDHGLLSSTASQTFRTRDLVSVMELGVIAMAKAVLYCT